MIKTKKKKNLSKKLIHEEYTEETSKDLNPSDKELFLNTFGTWQDERNAEEIINDIRLSRNFDIKVK